MAGESRLDHCSKECNGCALCASSDRIFESIKYIPSSKIIENEQVIFIDCDDTLVMWNHENFDKKIVIIDPYDSRELTLGIHEGHLKVLRDRSKRGAHIIVWSAGGYQWAAAVVKALGIESHVHQIMSKPFMYLDDKTAEEIMGTRLFLGFDSKYGKDKR